MTIVVTEGSTADYDAQRRYPNRKELKYVGDATQKDIAEMIARGEADAFGEGDVSNEYLRDEYSGRFDDVRLGVADRHDIDEQETFNFIVRKGSVGLLELLNEFIKQNGYPIR